MDIPTASAFAFVATLMFVTGVFVGKLIYDEDNVNRWLDKRESRRTQK